MTSGVSAMAAADTLRILSIDHGADDLGAVARSHGADPARLPRFKRLVAEAATAVAAGRAGHGMFLDDHLGKEAIDVAVRDDLWLARQYPHGHGADPASVMSTWPLSHVAKVMLSARAGSPVPVDTRLHEISKIAGACAHAGRELLVEVLPDEGQTAAGMMEQIEQHDITSAYWLVEPQSSTAAWAGITRFAARKGCCRGLIVIARTKDVTAAFSIAAREPMACGFVGGRSLFGEMLVPWLLKRVSDNEAQVNIADGYRAMCDAWDNARRGDAT